jgi:hypothetical protein
MNIDYSKNLHISLSNPTQIETKNKMDKKRRRKTSKDMGL